MQKISTLLLVLVSMYSATAQTASEYLFSKKENVALADVSTATVAIGSEKDETVSAAINFPFEFGGQRYQQLFVSPGGFVTLGRPFELEENSLQPDNFLTQAPVHPVLCVWGDELSTTSNGAVVYKIEGVAPYRKLIIDWKVKKYARESSTYDKHFQIWLFETTNKIEYVYGELFFDVYNLGGTIGIATSSIDFVSVDAASGIASTTTSEPNWEFGPGAGTAYQFTSPIVIEPLQVSNNATVVPVSCNGSLNGSISLGTITGGEGVYDITWSGPNGFSAKGDQITGLAAGEYQYTVTSGLEVIEGTIQITEPPIFDASLSVFPEYTVANQQAHTIYLGYGQQSVQLSVDGLDNENYSYAWHPITGIADAHAASTEVSPTEATTYTVTITNAGGCTITRSVIVNVVDVRSGKKIILCKKGKTTTKEVKDVEKELDKEAFLGACEDEVKPAKRAVASDEVVFVKNEVRVFPNPSSGKFTVTLKDAGASANIQVLNVNGRSVASRQLTSVSTSQNVDFDLSGKAEGLYFIKVFTNNKVQTAKLLLRK